MATSKQAELLKEIQEVRKRVQALQHAETARLEREAGTAEMFHHLTGNGKPGFMAIRDKVLSWEIKSNAILLLVIGDIIVRLIQK